MTHLLVLQTHICTICPSPLTHIHLHLSIYKTKFDLNHSSATILPKIITHEWKDRYNDERINQKYQLTNQINFIFSIYSSEFPNFYDSIQCDCINIGQHIVHMKTTYIYIHMHSLWMFVYCLEQYQYPFLLKWAMRNARIVFPSLCFLFSIGSREVWVFDVFLVVFCLFFLRTKLVSPCTVRYITLDVVVKKGPMNRNKKRKKRSCYYIYTMRSIVRGCSSQWNEKKKHWWNQYGIFELILFFVCSIWPYPVYLFNRWQYPA